MKKFLCLSFIWAAIATLFTPTAADAAEFSAFNGADVSGMSAAEVCQLMARGRNMSEYSAYTGFETDIAAYTGQGDVEMQFNSVGTGSFLNSSNAEPFVLQVVNTTAAKRSFYLSMGELYTRGSETAGQLRTGTFAAIEDTGTATSLTASTSNSISIEQFIAYTRTNPTNVPLLQLTSNEAVNQLALSISYFEQGIIKNSIVTTIPLRKYANGNQYNLQFQDIREDLYLSQQDVLIIPVAGSSTLSINIYPVGSLSTRKKLVEKINMVRTNAVRTPGLAQLEANVMNLPTSPGGTITINSGSLSNMALPSFYGR